MADLTRQQLCAALSISESTVRRLELAGLPFTPVGLRAKRYNLHEAKAWLRANQGIVSAPREQRGSRHGHQVGPFIEAAKKIKLRVMPS